MGDLTTTAAPPATLPATNDLTAALQQQLDAMQKTLDAEKKALGDSGVEVQSLSSKLAIADSKTRAYHRILTLQRSLVVSWKVAIEDLLKSVPQDGIHTGGVKGIVYRADLPTASVDLLRKSLEQMTEYLRREPADAAPVA